MKIKVYAANFNCRNFKFIDLRVDNPILPIQSIDMYGQSMRVTVDSYVNTAATKLTNLSY